MWVQDVLALVCDGENNQSQPVAYARMPDADCDGAGAEAESCAEIHSQKPASPKKKKVSPKAHVQRRNSTDGGMK